MARPIRRLRPGQPAPDGAPKRYVDYHGYAILRWKVGAYYVEVLEHRQVMGNPEGQVHHRNGDKLDNRPENLEVVSASEHQLMHHPRRIDPALAAAMYQAGSSTVAIATHFGSFPGNISRILRANGVTMRDSGSGQRQAVPPYLRAQIMTALNAGLPVEFVCRGAGLGRGVVERVRREESGRSE